MPKYFHFTRWLALYTLTLLCSFYNSLAQETGSAKIDSLLSASHHYYSQSNYDEAEQRAKSAFELSQYEGNVFGMGLSLQKEAVSLLGRPKKLKINRKKASDKLLESLDIFSSLNKTESRIQSLEYLKWIALKNNNSKKVELYSGQIEDLKLLLQADATASQLTEQSNLLSTEIEQLNTQRIYLSDKLNELNKEQLQAELLIALQKNNVDSLQFQTQKDSLVLAQKESILSEQEAVIALQQNRQYLYYALLGILLLFIIFVYMRYKETKKHNDELALKNEIIQEEREKSEGLLLNILPNRVANELKVQGFAQARKYDMATVFFSDFVNFSSIANKLSPEKLVSLLDEYFKLFDKVIEKHGLEKIKTIGDAYMCVGGLPEKNDSHPSDVILAALEIQSILNQRKVDKEMADELFFEARIGIHTGPLVAGVVGSKKFAFDIWGDTVNVASRLESGGAPGKVNISQSTYELVKDKFMFISRGELPIKNLGEIDMYFVEKN